MDDNEFQRQYVKLNLSPAAQAVIERARNGPSRRVGGGGGNVPGSYPSRKMGVGIQFESHTVELPGIVEYEYDRDVLAYFDQPDAIKLTYPHKGRERFASLHTCDFLVMRSTGVSYEEWKLESDLIKLAEKMPTRYVRGEDGQWSCPPGEAYAKKLGFGYRLRSAADINWNLQANLNYLDDYMRPKIRMTDSGPVTDPLTPDTEIAKLLIDHVNSDQGITFVELRQRVEAKRLAKGSVKVGAVANTLNILIVRQELYVDLLNERLTPQHQDRGSCIHDPGDGTGLRVHTGKVTLS